jgi:serine/threonine protein kinase
MMFGISALHRIGVVHSDLKPDNIILIPDETVSIGYRLRIIDMDWAIFSDRRAPWHGKQGYVGTPGYQSPEHLRGDVPTPASDVFTCGLMLGQLLGGRHPFQEAIDRDTYSAAVLDGEFEPIHINKPIDRVPDIRAVEDILNACLAIDPTTRPTAAQVADGLIGKAAESSRPSVHGHPPGGPTMAATKGAPKVPAGGAVELWFGGRRVTSVSIDSALGRRHFLGIDPDARFLSEPQFRLFRLSGRWHIEPSPGTANETVVDGRRLEHAEPVSEGMQVAVGNTTKGVTRFPLELRIVAK